MATSTLWRINITDNNGGSQLGVNDFQFRVAVGVPVAFPGGTVFDADSQGTSASFASDGDILEGWRTVAATTASSWSAEFSTTKEIVAYVIRGDSDITFSPLDFTLDYWDGGSWVTVDTQTAQSSWTPYQVREYTVGVAGYDEHVGIWNEASDQWRMVITANNGDPDIGLIDWKMRPQTDAYVFMDETYFGTATASSEAVSHPASDATDDDNAVSSWRTDAEATGTFYYTFPDGLIFEPIAYVFRSEFIDNMPRNFTLEYFDYITNDWVICDTRINQGPDAFDGTDHSYVITRDFSPQGILGGTPDNDCTFPELTVNGLLNVPTDTYVGGDLAISSLTLSATHALANDGSIFITALTASGSGESGALVTGNSFFPELEMAAGGFADGMTMPKFSLAATGVAGTTADGDADIPAFRAAGGFADGIVLEGVTLSASGFAGILINGAVSMPLLSVDGGLDAALALEELTLAGTMVAGALMTGDAVLLAPTVDASFAFQTDIVLPELSVSATGFTGGAFAGNAIMLAPTVDAFMYEDTTAQGDVTFSILAAAGSMYGGNFIEGSVTIPRVSLDGVAVAGNVATASITLPLLSVDAEGHFSAIGTADIELMALLVNGVMSNPQELLNPTTIALNTRVKAVTTYDGVAFNSFANFNGVTLAASADGIVALTGADDLGVPIAAYVLSGESDFNTEQFKRVITGYAGYRADGDLELTLITDEHHEFIYRLAARQGSGTIHASRVKFGRGVEGKYWQWRMANVDGGDFTLDSLTLNAQELGRRV
jgi:hypothetical protein